LGAYRRWTWVAYRLTQSTLPIGVVLIGLLTRVALAPYTSWSADNSVWYTTSLSGFYGLHLYERPGFSYPAIWGYYLQILGSFVRLAGLGPTFFGVSNPDLLSASTATNDFSTTVTSPEFNLLFRSGLFGCDLLTGLLIYRFVRHLTGDVRRARLGFTLWFLNPFVIYQTAVQGAPDTLVGFTVLATVALVLYGRPFWGGAAWALGIVTKLSPVVLGPSLVIALGLGVRARTFGSTKSRVVKVGLFALGAAVAVAWLLTPEVLGGSVQAMAHNIFARTQEGITVGGLSFIGIRYLKPWSWLLAWSYDNSSELLRATTIAQAAAIAAWSLWTAITARRNPAFGLLVGTVGTLASFTLVAPISNPQYVLWWLPALIVVVVFTKRGYWQLAVVTVAPLAFCLAILGPMAILAPLATYTHLITAKDLGDAVIHWYTAPGKVWGATLVDDFLGPSALFTVIALLSLFSVWVRMALTHQEPEIAAPN
jgi:hypothetical protein